MNQSKLLKKNSKNYHHGDLKQALVAAGIEILETSGLDGLSLRAIAAHVGVSHTAPKNHFGSLRGLLTAIGTEGFRRHSEAMKTGASEGTTREDRLTSAMEGYVAFAETHPALFQMMFSPLYCDFSDEKLLREARKSYAVLEDVATNLSYGKSGLSEGQLRSEMMLWSFVHGFATLRITGQFRDEGAFSVADVLPTFAYNSRSGP